MDQNMGTAKWWHEHGYEVQRDPRRSERFVYRHHQVRATTETVAQYRFKRYYQQWNDAIEQEFSDFLHTICEEQLADQSRFMNADQRSRLYYRLLRESQRIAEIYTQVYNPPNADRLRFLSQKIVEKHYGDVTTIYLVDFFTSRRILERLEFSSYWDAYHYVMAHFIPPYFRNRLFELSSTVTSEGRVVHYYHSGNLDDYEWVTSASIYSYTVLRDV